VIKYQCSFMAVAAGLQGYGRLNSTGNILRSRPYNQER
jgi:hypothetical protein